MVIEIPPLKKSNYLGVWYNLDICATIVNNQFVKYEKVNFFSIKHSSTYSFGIPNECLKERRLRNFKLGGVVLRNSLEL